MSDKNNSTTHKFQIGYKKLKKLDLSKMEEQYVNEDPSVDYNPFRISDLQAYNPIYNRFFQMDETNYNMITLNNRCLANDLKTVYSENGKIDKNIHIKYSPLLNPIHFLIGKYDLNSAVYKTLPKYDSDTKTCMAKNLDENNSSYTDAFFSYLSSMLSETHGWIHGVEYYGSYLGIQQKFKMDIMDDFDYVNDTPYFLDNIGKRFDIDENVKMLLNDGNPGSGSRNNRIKINIANDSDNIDLDIDNVEAILDIENVVNDDTPVLIEDIAVPEEQGVSLNTRGDDDDSSSDSSNTSESGSDVWETESESGSVDKESDEESELESDASDDDEQKLFCYLHEFPVQLIFQEKCTDTLDSLLMHKRITNDELTSAMFQTIMILIAYQKAFDFTHNDLHTNNIMYIETDEPYLYYCYENTHYKVPTYGRIFKLIDFGRAIYRFNGKLFCSDSFAPNNDAHTQYNCEPYMNENKPRIDPNPSFDLTRLGCSIYDFIFEDFEPGENIPEIHKIIWEWCLDDSGKSVVYKKTGQERYPGFKLYKMIARAVHKHVPKEQLKRPLFAEFKDVANPAAFNVDLMPRYMVASTDK